MRLIDEEYRRHPFRGARRMSDWLGDQGDPACRQRVGRLMRILGLQAIYPRKRLSLGNREHKKYPYLLRGLRIDRPDQVWCSDITYIRLPGGFVYLTAVMDWHSRFVLSWELSITMDSEFCVSTLDRALEGARPEIFNTDQGSQYTSDDFTGRLKRDGIQISMDGREALRAYFAFYNHERRHQGLDRRTPWEVYQAGV